MTDDSERDHFRPMPSRLGGEREDRIERARRKLSYFVPFLDDYLRGILPNDLVLLGAPSGIGKTELATNIACANAESGKRVHYFALEAEEREIERRKKYGILVRLLYQAGHPQRERMNFTDWYLGELEDICGDFDREADLIVLQKLGKLETYYRRQIFTANRLRQTILEIHKVSDLIVVDHLHYIDSDDENENRALGETVKVIRDVSLRIGVPILLVAHLRKRDPRAKQLIATLDDFHGSSNITKIATQVIAIERAWGVDADRWWKSPTFVSVVKDRRSGQPREVALCDFDLRVKAYGGRYTLGKIAGSEWNQIAMNEAPSWARHHEPRQEMPQRA